VGAEVQSRLALARDFGRHIDRFATLGSAQNASGMGDREFAELKKRGRGSRPRNSRGIRGVRVAEGGRRWCESGAEPVDVGADPSHLLDTRALISAELPTRRRRHLWLAAVWHNRGAAT